MTWWITWTICRSEGNEHFQKLHYKGIILSISCRVLRVILSQMSCTKVTFNPSSWPNSRAQGLHSDFKSFIPTKSSTKQHVWHRAGIPIRTHIPSFSCLNCWADLIHCVHCEFVPPCLQISHVLWARPSTAHSKPHGGWGIHFLLPLE